MNIGEPCGRWDLPDLADMHCAGCGFTAEEHPAWIRRAHALTDVGQKVKKVQQ